MLHDKWSFVLNMVDGMKNGKLARLYVWFLRDKMTCYKKGITINDKAKVAIGYRALSGDHDSRGFTSGTIHGWPEQEEFLLKYALQYYGPEKIYTIQYDKK